MPESRPSATAYPESVERLITELAHLPGVGRRSAERLAFHVLKADPTDALKLARGLPTGSQLEYASKAVLADAIEGRRPV